MDTTARTPAQNEVRTFAALAPDQDLSYPVLASGAVMMMPGDEEETIDAAILEGLVHP